MDPRGWAAGMRRLAEGWSHGRRLRRTLPNGVSLYVSPDSQLRYLAGALEPDLIALARDRVTGDSVVWDIGANCGIFAFGCAAARQVVAVEPDPFLGHLIQDSVRMNGAPVRLVSAAVGAAPGLAEFSIAGRGRASNHLSRFGGRSQTGGERCRFLTPVVTLDGLLETLDPPSLVKIDVEGAEIDVLAGARTLLHSARPVLYVETDDSTHAACEAILRDAGYRLTLASGENWICTPE